MFEPDEPGPLSAAADDLARAGRDVQRRTPHHSAPTPAPRAHRRTNGHPARGRLAPRRRSGRPSDARPRRAQRRGGRPTRRATADAPSRGRPRRHRAARGRRHRLARRCAGGHDTSSRAAATDRRRRRQPVRARRAVPTHAAGPASQPTDKGREVDEQQKRRSGPQQSGPRLWPSLSQRASWRWISQRMRPSSHRVQPWPGLSSWCHRSDSVANRGAGGSESGPHAVQSIQ